MEWFFPGRPDAKNSELPLQGVQRVPLLVQELRSCLPRGVAKRKNEGRSTQGIYWLGY